MNFVHKMCLLSLLCSASLASASSWTPTQGIFSWRDGYKEVLRTQGKALECVSRRSKRGDKKILTCAGDGSAKVVVMTKVTQKQWEKVDEVSFPDVYLAKLRMFESEKTPDLLLGVTECTEFCEEGTSFFLVKKTGKVLPLGSFPYEVTSWVKEYKEGYLGPLPSVLSIVGNSDSLSFLLTTSVPLSFFKSDEKNSVEQCSKKFVYARNKGSFIPVFE